MLKSVSQSFYSDFNVESGTTCTSPYRRIKRLLYPVDRFPLNDSDAQSLYENVVSALENVLDVKREEVDFDKTWRHYSSSTTDESFETYFGSVIIHTTDLTLLPLMGLCQVLYDYVVWGSYLERAQFREDYVAKFGKDPYVNPLTQFRWRLGANMTQEHFVSIQSKRAQFQAFIETIFGNNSIMVSPFSYGEPDARDIYRPRLVHSSCFQC